MSSDHVNHRGVSDQAVNVSQGSDTASDENPVEATADKADSDREIEPSAKALAHETDKSMARSSDAKSPLDGLDFRHPGFLAWALNVHPFWRYFTTVSCAHYPKSSSPHKAISAYAEEHKFFMYCCIIADFLAIITIVLLYLGFGAGAAYKFFFS